MDRKKFIKTLFGAAAATVVGGKLDAIVPAVKPGIDGATFKMKLNKSWFKPGDILENDQKNITIYTCREALYQWRKGVNNQLLWGVQLHTKK